MKNVFAGVESASLYQIAYNLHNDLHVTVYHFKSLGLSHLT